MNITQLPLTKSLFEDNTISIFTEEVRFVKFDEDPLLISCTLYRLIKEKPNSMHRCWSIEAHAKEIAKQITSEDRAFSSTISKYYRDKLLVSRLKSIPLSEFRTDLYTYLTERPTRISEKFIGMIYKLPYFYEYDVGVTSIFGLDHTECSQGSHFTDTKTLSFISKLDAHKKHKKEYEYWFNDDAGVRYMVPVAKNNCLLKLWENTIDTEQVNINGKFEQKYKDDRSYYVATGWKIDG